MFFLNEWATQNKKGFQVTIIIIWQINIDFLYAFALHFDILWSLNYPTLDVSKEKIYGNTWSSFWKLIKWLHLFENHIVRKWSSNNTRTVLLYCFMLYFLYECWRAKIIKNIQENLYFLFQPFLPYIVCPYYLLFKLIYLMLLANTLTTTLYT